MSDSLTYRMLSPSDHKQMYRSFIEAFSEDAVQVLLSKDDFQRRFFDKLNMTFEVSPAALSGDKLVGFIFQTIHMYEGELAAYNGGTGVIPGYRGLGMVSQLYDLAMPELRNRGVKKCVLEVITTNEVAIRAYGKYGFLIKKRFHCFTQTIRMKPTENHDIILEKTTSLDLSTLQRLGEDYAGMGDQLVQIIDNPNNESVVVAKIENDIVGYITFQSYLGRVSQLTVKPDLRGQRIATSLLHYAQEASDHPLTVINVAESALDVVNFLTKSGFKNHLDQFEMQMRI